MKTAIINSYYYEKQITKDGHTEQPKIVVASKENEKERKE